MDVILKQKKGLRKKHILFILGGALLLLIIIWIFLGNHASKLSVDSKTINIQSVERSLFNDYIRVNGQVLPISTIQISAIEGGMVSEKLIEEGTMVSKGDIIIRLTNPSLNLSILSSEADLAEKQNMLRNTQVAMEQEKLNLKREKLQLDLDVERRKRTAEQYRKLHEENMISKEDYLQANENYTFAVDGRNLVVERQKQDSIYRSIQIDQMEDNLRSIRKNMELIRQRVDDLNVKSSIDGQLSLLDVEIGQNVPAGGRIGQVNVLSDYKVEASIDEYYIDKVNTGLNATFERQDKTFDLRVRKVFPEVREKQFKADFVFKGERPDNIRAGQTYYINLQLGEPTEAIIVPRGVFYQTTGGQWIFVLAPDGKKAVKRKITIGRQNPNYYEVTSGLEPGEKVIVSSYDTYGNVEELILN